MIQNHLATLLDALRIEIARLDEIELGYAKGVNAVHAPQPGGAEHLATELALDVEHPLVCFYRLCGAIDLSDVHVGYFIHPVESILRGIRQGEPTQLAATLPVAVIPFGSDGGGNRLVVAVESREVWYLPAGAVHDAVYESAERARVIAIDLPALIERLLADTIAFVEGKSGWEYIG